MRDPVNMWDLDGPEAQRAAGACPLEVPPGVQFAVDVNELVQQHRGYDLEPRVEMSLSCADYSILVDGVLCEAEVAVERKSLQDILGCCSGDRRRWEANLERLATVRRPVVVLETSWASISRGGFRHTRLNERTVMGSLVAWQQRHRIPFLFCGNAIEARRVTQWWLLRSVCDHFNEIGRPVKRAAMESSVRRRRSSES